MLIKCDRRKPGCSLYNISIINASPVVVTKCTNKFTLHFTQTPYLCAALLLTVSRTYCKVLLPTVNSVWCNERSASTTNINFRRIFTKQCLSRLAVRLSMRRPDFHHSSVHVRFVVYKMALGQVFPEYVGFSLSASFHQRSMLIFNYMFVIEKGETWIN